MGKDNNVIGICCGITFLIPIIFYAWSINPLLVIIPTFLILLVIGLIKKPKQTGTLLAALVSVSALVWGFTSYPFWSIRVLSILLGITAIHIVRKKIIERKIRKLENEIIKNLNSRIVKFDVEAEKLNVTRETLKSAYRSLLSRGKIFGVIDEENQQFVYFTSDEVNGIVDFLNSKGIVYINDLAIGLDLTPILTQKVIAKLQEQGYIEGIFTSDNCFITYKKLINSIIELINDTNRLDISSFADILKVPKEEIKSVVVALASEIQSLLKKWPDNKEIKLLCIRENIRLPENCIVTLLNWLIAENKIHGPKSGFSREELASGLVSFTDRLGVKRWGTSEQVKEWKRIELGLHNNFAEYEPREFEELIARLFIRMGYQVKLTPEKADYGADIIAEKNDERIVIEVKRWKEEHVGAEHIRSLIGSMSSFGATKAIFVTTSDFTKRAENQADRARQGGTRIELWNGYELRKRIEKYFIEELPKTDENIMDIEEINEDPYKRFLRRMLEHDRKINR